MTVFARVMVFALAMVLGLAAEAATKVRLGFVHVELVDGPLFLGVIRNHFTDQGVEVELVRFDNGTQINQALAGGRIDAALAGAALIQNFAVQGNGVIIAPAYMDTNDLFANPGMGVKSLADLAGKQIALPIGTTAHVLLDWALADAGLDMSKVKLVNTSYASTSAAIISGAVPASISNASNSRVIRREKPEVLKLADLKKYVPNRVVIGGLVASNAFYESNKPALIDLTTGYVRAYRETWTDKAAQREIYNRYYAKDESFDDFNSNIVDNIAFPSPEQWLKYLEDGSVEKWTIDVAKTLQRLGALNTIADPKKFLDVSIYREAIRRSAAGQRKQ